MRRPIEHLFTVDVEEYFHASALRGAAPPDSWASLPSRVVASTERLLESMEAAGARGTFFVLGWVAQRHPALVRRIAEAGHEVASHGWGHDSITHLWPNELREDVRRSRGVLEDLLGEEVRGYRAPNFSIVRGWGWAFDVLVGEGIAYDSSVFPGRVGHPRGASPVPYRIHRTGGSLWEIPLASARLGPLRVPTGGAFLRLLPFAATEAGLLQAEAEGRAGTFYLHPWELDPEQPRLKVGSLTRLRHYGGQRSCRGRVERLLARFRFTSIAHALAPAPGPAVDAPAASCA